ncbi:T9SS type A sorting domain-containing protein, partial [Apibacter adventoris]
IQDKTLPQPGKLTLDCNSINGSTLEVGSSFNKTLQLKYTVIGNPINFTGYKKTEKGMTIEVGTEGQQISLSGSGVIAVTISGTPTQIGIIPIEVETKSCNITIQDKTLPQPGKLTLDCNSINGSTLEVGSSFNKTLQLKYTVIGNPINFTGYKKTEKGMTIEVGTEGQQISLSGSGVIAVTISGTPTQIGIIPIEVETKSCNITIQDKTLPQPGKLTLDCNSINGSTLEVGSSSNKTLQLKYTVIGNPINFTGYKKTEKGITIEVGTEGQQISLSGSGVIAVTISGTPTQSGSLSLEINNRSCNLSIENKQIKKNELKLVPNPLNTSVGSIYINSDFEDNHATITIFDVSGKIIYINNYIVKKGEQKLEFKSPVLSGIYIVQFKSSKITKTLKLIVE